MVIPKQIGMTKDGKTAIQLVERFTTTSGEIRRCSNGTPHALGASAPRLIYLIGKVYQIREVYLNRRGEKFRFLYANLLSVKVGQIY